MHTAHGRRARSLSLSLASSPSLSLYPLHQTRLVSSLHGWCFSVSSASSCVKSVCWHIANTEMRAMLCCCRFLCVDHNNQRALTTVANRATSLYTIFGIGTIEQERMVWCRTRISRHGCRRRCCVSAIIPFCDSFFLKLYMFVDGIQHTVYATLKNEDWERATQKRRENWFLLHCRCAEETTRTCRYVGIYIYIPCLSVVWGHKWVCNLYEYRSIVGSIYDIYRITCIIWVKAKRIYDDKNTGFYFYREFKFIYFGYLYWLFVLPFWNQGI